MKTIDKVISLLEKFQKRLDRVGRESAQNRDSLAALDGRHNTLTTFVGGLRDDAVKLKSADQTLLDRIQEVEFKNNKREEAQVLRDQSNVQSLVNLRDSTKKAFDQVAADVKNLLTTVQRLNERQGQLESQNLSLVSTVSLLQNRINTPAPAPSLPIGHEWVNKKLSGVYAVADEFEKRIKQLETPAPPTVIKVPFIYSERYMGFNLGVLENVLYVGGEKFTFSGAIQDISVRPYGVLITLLRGAQYLLCGGPTVDQMYLNLFKKA